MPLLELDNIHTYYGHIHALKGISLQVEEGEIVTLIGANGAGKSSTLRTISGLVRARQGKVLLQGRDITHLPPHEIVAAGVGHVPEGRGIFARLTVRENGVCFSLVSAPSGAPEPERRHPLGWGAADVSYGARPDAQAAYLADGRAVYGSGASAGRSHLRGNPPAQPDRGGDYPAGGAKRPYGAQIRRSSVCTGDWQDCTLRPGE